ncbi:MAG: hypothetical protein ACI4GD_04395 [Lachnospiraceae bacterium]
MFGRFFKKVPLLYIPIGTISILANVLLISGYIGILGSASFFIVRLGVILFLVSVIGRLIKPHGNTDLYNIEITAYVIWFVFAMLMAAFLFGRYNITHDDYSHWGIIVKRMLYYNALPTGDDLFIQFQSYPEGISVWNYWVCHFVDGSDWTMQWAQFLVNAACLLPLFYAVGRKKWFGTLIVLIYSLLVLNVNVPLYSSLSVDTVIALVGVIPVITLLLYLRSRDEGTAFFCHIGPQNFETMQFAVIQAIILGFCTMIKSSGLFFWIFFVCVFAFLYNGIHKKKFMAVYIAIPAIINILWQIHYSIVFPEGNLSNHAISLTRYISIIKTRTLSDVLRTIYHFFANSYGLECYYTFIVMIILYFSLRASRKYLSDRKLLDIDIWAFVSWMAGLFLMYLFSMQDSEVYRVISIDRYRSTIELFIYMTWSMFIIKAVTNDISYSGIISKLKCFFGNIKNKLRNFKELLHKTVTKDDIRQFMSKVREPLTVIAFAVMLVSMPKNPYGPWKGWKMYIDLRLDLIKAMEDKTVCQDDHVILYDSNEYFRNWSTEELKNTLASNEYYIAQYTLNSQDFSMYNNWNDIEEYCSLNPERKIIVYLLVNNEKTKEINSLYGYEENNKIIRIR